MMKITTLVLAIFIGIIAISCSRSSGSEDATSQDQALPPITQSGNDTFGVKINGKVFTPKSSKNDLSNIGYPRYNGIREYFTYNGSNTFSPSIYLDKGSLTGISLRVNDLQGITTKEYLLNGQDQNNPQGLITIGYLIYNSTTIKQQYNAITNSGSIFITRNDENFISGTFSGKLKNISDSNDIIEITDGRFDFNKNTINDHVFP